MVSAKNLLNVQRNVDIAAGGVGIRAHHVRLFHQIFRHAALDARQLEDKKVRSAIKTDFILSAEIMAITLAAVSLTPLVFWVRKVARAWTNSVRAVELADVMRRVFLGAVLTYAFLVLGMALGGPFAHRVLPFDRILEEVKSGGVDAGLLIHEGQLTYHTQGLHLWADLGAWWHDQTGLPLPLGGNVVRRALGPELIAAVSKDLRASIAYGLDHREDALRYALRFARGLDRETTDRFVGMYVNHFTLDYGSRGRQAVQTLLERGAAVIVASHLGRPKGKVNDAMRLKPVADRLSQLLGRPVRMTGDALGPGVQVAIEKLRPGDLLLLENLRFHAEEEANDPEFAKALAEMADVYVNDAFGSAHRAHASTEGITHHVPAVAGLLLEREVDALSCLLERPPRPFHTVIGGAKVSGKLGVLDNLMTGRLLRMGGHFLLDAVWWGPAKRQELANRAAVERIIDFLEIQSIRKTPAGKLPYGLQKRVELGRALAAEPKLLLLDEPMAGMNVEEKEDMSRFILDVNGEFGTTIALIEHDMGVVMDISDRVVVLEYGRKIADGTPDVVRSDQKVIDAYLGVSH